MKFQNEIRKMKKGDRFRSNESDIFIGEHGVPFWDREPSVPVHLIPENMDLEGEIIRAEPEVLTVSEIIDKNSELFNNEWAKTNPLDFAVMCSKQSYLNGQNKEWKRLKPLVVLVKNWIELINEKSLPMMAVGDHLKYSAKTYEFIKELTPPWELEK